MAFDLCCAAADDEKLSDIELVGISDAVCLLEPFDGGRVFSSDAIERFAFFDDVPRFACRKVSCCRDRELLSNFEEVGIGNSVEARKLRKGDTVASRDGEKGFPFPHAVGCRALRRFLLGLRREGGSGCGLGLRVAADDIRIARDDSANGGNIGISWQLVSFDALVGSDGAQAHFASLLASGKQQRCQQNSRKKQGKGRTAKHALYCSEGSISRQEADKELCKELRLSAKQLFLSHRFPQDLRQLHRAVFSLPVFQQSRHRAPDRQARAVQGVGKLCPLDSFASKASV